jgi:WD40 repeat protein|tara:strand:- start:645 stop:2156 length:1512 start_codon:yes stop_codon:yes gene_type:complete
MSLDFSETYKRTGPPPVFSPDGTKIATAVDHRLVLRDAETCGVIFMQECFCKISAIEWSSDSDHVLCAMYKKNQGKVQVFKSSDDEWRCAIDEGPAGLVFARWAPCGTRVLTISEFNLRVSVWSLVDTSCVYIKHPKFDSGRGLDFSPDGRFLCVVERKQCVDSIVVIDCGSWTTAAKFQSSVDDVADAKWSPDSTSIAVVPSPHSESGLLVLHSPDGRVLREFKPEEDETSAFSKDGKTATAASSSGITCHRWSSGGSFLATGSRDRKTRVMNHVSWRAFATLTHSSRIVAPATVAVYQETETKVTGTFKKAKETARGENENENLNPDREWYEDSDSAGASSAKDPVRQARIRQKGLLDGTLVPKYVVVALPATIAVGALKSSKHASENSTQSPCDDGVSRIEWSFNDRFLATLDSTSPNTVYVWDMVNIELTAVLVQMENVVHFKWDPRGNRLAAVTGSERGKGLFQLPHTASLIAHTRPSERTVTCARCHDCLRILSSTV